MTTEDSDAHAKLARLTDNLTRVEVLSARLMQAIAARKPHDQALDGPAQDIWKVYFNGLQFKVDGCKRGSHFRFEAFKGRETSFVGPLHLHHGVAVTKLG